MSSLPLAKLKTRLKAWVMACSGLTTDKIITANQNAPKPLMPYITIDAVRTINSVGSEDQEINQTDGTIERISVRRIMSEIVCYSDNAQVILNDVLTGLHRSDIYQTFHDDDISIINRSASQVKNLSYQENDGRFVPRANLEVNFDVLCDDTALNLGYFDNVAYQLQFNHDGIPENQINPIIEIETNLVNNPTQDIFIPLDSPTFINGSFTIEFNSINFEWSEVENADYYLFDLALDSGFTSFVDGYFERIVFGESLLVSGLDPDTTYYARIRSVFND